jgi:hypothetical protein
VSATLPNLDNNEAPLACPLESGFCSGRAAGLGNENSGVVGTAGTGLVTGAAAPEDCGITNGLGLGFCSPGLASSAGLVGGINGVGPGLVNENDGVEVVAAAAVAGNKGAALAVEVAGFSSKALKLKGEG